MVNLIPDGYSVVGWDAARADGWDAARALACGNDKAMRKD